MLRRLHSLPGLIAALLLSVLAISGAVLSVNPALERMGASVPPNGQVSVATLADRVARHYASVEQIQRTASGSVIVYYSREGQMGADYVDLRTGQGLSPYTPSSTSRWIKDLHRSLLMDTPGRALTGLSAVTMLILCLSGVALLAKRQGGWRHVFSPVRGDLKQRWHTRLGRIAVAGLLLSSLTGMFMSATTFELIPDGALGEPDFPSVVVTAPAAPIGTLQALRAVDVNALRELVYPVPGSAETFYFLRTAQGDGYVDPTSGALLTYRTHDGARRLYELVYQLHTGEGLAWLGLLLGLCALTVPLMGATGALMWWQRRSSMPRIAHNAAKQSARTLILVGSETNTTWGFAKTLHDALYGAGLPVHTAAMNGLSDACRHAERVFILTSTYGDGSAPQSADQFFQQLEMLDPRWRPDFAVLGFGDRQFPEFCGFARDVHDRLVAHGWHAALDFDTINRQSTQEFARWGLAVGRLLHCDLKLEHTPRRPRTRPLALISRVDYGSQVDAPTSILRFGPVVAGNILERMGRVVGLGGLPRFEAGDLAGIVPQGSTVPRFYSLASGCCNGFLEICVRKHPDGLCSSMLHALQPGDRVDAFIKRNPDFRPSSGRSPIILVGAGTGIGPLAGFIRNNTAKHPMYLYWGGRDPGSDFLYEPELREYLSDRRLTQLSTAFSRSGERAYVQDRITADAALVRRLIEEGAQVLVCGGRSMAASIALAFNRILAPFGLDVDTLKHQGRYREDVF
ncbi:nitric oxide synthase [Parapusillimonas sp. SGNA-6]|nr:nitric oxide synthase [Parapusillimonas sp. SGNA-6]